MMDSGWEVTTLNSVVDEELEALPVDMRARLTRISKLIEEVGLPRVGMPYVRPVQPPLWEIRLSGRDGIARALYVTARGKRLIILRAFVKKTQATPMHEIRLALQRARILTLS